MQSRGCVGCLYGACAFKCRTPCSAARLLASLPFPSNTDTTSTTPSAASVSTMIVFHPNCTLPLDGNKYVAAANVRTTLDILWSSLATLVACTYSVLHLNVPEQRRGRDPGWKGDLRWSCRRLKRTLKHCIASLLAPELVLGDSISALVQAKRSLRFLRRKFPDLAPRITLSHMLLADMGGFVVHYPPWKSPERCPVASADAIQALPLAYESLTKDVNDSETEAQLQAVSVSSRAAPLSRDAANTESSGRPTNDESTLRRAASASSRFNLHTERAAGVRVALPNLDGLAWSVQSEEHTVTAQAGWQDEMWCTLCTAHFHGMRSELMVQIPSQEEIMDKSKSDLLAKSLVVLQISYYMVAVLVRVSRSMTISELELGTIAFVACSVASYAVSMKTPKSVETVFELQADRPYFAEDRAFRRKFLVQRRESYLSFYYLIRGTENKVLLAAFLFGCIHIAGWNLTFPTAVDKGIWRASAIVMTVVPIAMKPMGGCIGPLLCALYPLARLAIIVEMFRGLGYLPPAAFEATWTANVPHIG